MDNEKKTEIPFGAFDSELIRQEISIPNGFKAVIDGNKIILIRAESEDERIRKRIIQALHGDVLEMSEMNDCLDWLEKQGEQKPTIEMKTPEESLDIDSETYNKIVDECIYGEQKSQRMISAEAKEAMYAKTAWSEEDEKMLADACIMLDWYRGNNWWKAQHIKNWLKALKQRCAWKPSDEQMATLYKYAEQNNYDGSILTSLYNDLNKLKGE